MASKPTTRRRASCSSAPPQQGHPLAMYNLALHYRDGSHGIKRDVGQAYEWFAKSAEAGLVSAMVELGDALIIWPRADGSNNPRRGVEWYAARRGSRLGARQAAARDDLPDAASTARDDDSNSRAAGLRSGVALVRARGRDRRQRRRRRWLAIMMEEGVGLARPQPEIAERYWRLAAYGGSSLAQVEFAERLQPWLRAGQAGIRRAARPSICCSAR